MAVFLWKMQKQSFLDTILLLMVLKNKLYMLQGFKSFLMRGNVIDLAVGVVIGAAFGGVVNSLVADVITPIIGAIAKIPDFSGLALTLNGSKLMYGNFLNALISFIIVAAAIYFFVVIPVNKAMGLGKKNEKEEPVEPAEDIKLLREIRDALKK